MEGVGGMGPGSKTQSRSHLHRSLESKFLALSLYEVVYLITVSLVFTYFLLLINITYFIFINLFYK